MRQIIYALRFTGEATPGEHGVLRATTTSESSSIESAVRENGIDGAIKQVAGGSARFSSEVRMTGDTSFDEIGTISFGAGHRLTFSTVGEGHIAPSPEDGLMHGVVDWKIESGQGQFAGASGYITSNFTLDGAGQVTDHHFGVIWIK